MCRFRADSACETTSAVSRLASVIPRYSQTEMAEYSSKERKLELWLEVELAALDAWADLGVVPAEAARRIRSAAAPPTPERVAEIERQTQPRPRRIRRRGGRATRRRGPALAALRAHLLRRHRHGALATDPRGRIAAPGRRRRLPRGRGPEGRGASRNAPDRPYPWHSRRAHDLRPQSRQVGDGAAAADAASPGPSRW